MTGKKTGKKPTRIEHPRNLQDPKARGAFVDQLVKDVADEVEAERKRLGKPPLKK